VASGGVLAAYSCGGSRGIGEIPHRVPFLFPQNAGTDDGPTIAWFGEAASRRMETLPPERIDKGASRPLKCLIDGRSEESKQGTRYGIRPNPRLPPQL
jgi:hypothetical protein